MAYRERIAAEYFGPAYQQEVRWVGGPEAEGAAAQGGGTRKAEQAGEVDGGERASGKGSAAADAEPGVVVRRRSAQLKEE